MVGALPPARPVVDQDKDDILIPIASGVQELLFSPVGPFQNRPAFVAGPEPDTGLAKVVQEATRLNCRLWASRDKSQISTRVNQYNGEVCGPYLDSLGELPTDGFVAPPFRGGQCFGDSYNFTFTATDLQGNRASSQRNTNGRLVGVGQETLPGGNVRGGYFRQLTPQSPVEFIPLQIGNPGTDTNPVISNVVRVSGLPDDCGDPPTEVQPPATVTPVTPIVPTITVNLPGVGPVTINVDLDPEGYPVICAPDVGTCITINPEIGIGIGGPDGGPGGPGEGPPKPPPGDVGTPGSGETAGPGGDAEGEAPPGSEIVGLRLTLTVIPEGARSFAPGVYRGPAYIYMGTPAGLDQDYAGSMLAETQFVFAEREGLTNWRVKSNDEFVIFVVPYYREVV